MKRRLTGADIFCFCASALYPFITKTTIACLLLTVFSGTLNAVTITVQSQEKQMMRYGLDFERLWYWYGSQTYLEDCAEWSVVDCDVDYLRVAINCGYELVEGTYNLSAYTKKIIPMMETMKAANPDIKFFASPRPLNEAIDNAKWQPYPIWITGAPDAYTADYDFDWQKCAEYLVRYLVLMDSYGFKISYLDVTNEWQLYQNGWRVYPLDVLNIRNYLIANLPAYNIEMPLIVAPSAWSFSQGATFMSRAKTDGATGGFDIAASHNTGYEGTAQIFADAVTGLGEDKEVWDSEVHGWKGSNTADEISTSNQMFDRIRAGFSGLNGWLAIGTTNQKHCYFLNYGSGVTRNVKYYIFKKLSTTSNYGHALDVNQPADFTSTTALIRDDILTIWVLNNSSVDVANVEFVLNNQIIADTPIKSTRWHSSISIEGQSNNINKLSDTQFQSTVKANSLYCFEIRVFPPDLNGVLQAHYAFDGNTDDSSDFLRHGVAGGDEAYSAGIIDQAMVFDGVDDYVEIPDDSGLNPNLYSWSTSFWMRSETPSQHARLVSKRADSGSYTQYSIGLSDGDSYYWPSGSKITFLFRETSGKEKGGYTTSDVDFSEWTHVAVVLDRTASTVHVYIDGVSVPVTLDHNGTFPDIENMSPLYIGGNPSALNPYQGLMDDVRIYGGALDDYGIAALYFKGHPDSEICLLKENNLIYDYTADCQVDLSDAALFASQWLISTDTTDLAGLASEWLMTDLYSASMLETIYETFDSDPYSNGWVNAQGGNTTFTYNTDGYLDASIYRDSTNTARFYKALYQSYDQTDEFWFEYDAQIVSASSNFQRAYAGLFNDNDLSDNEHDMIAARFAYWEYQSTPRNNRHDLYCFATNGTNLTSTGDPVSPGIAYGQNIRVKIHYWYESGIGKASLDVYAINTDGSTGSLIMAAPAATVIAAGNTLTLNCMGLGNRTDGTSSDNNVIKIDNMYFSTEAENLSPVSPSF